MKLIVLAIVLFCIISINIYSQSCEECKDRNIIVYDNKVTVTEPDINLPPEELIKKLAEWHNLFYIAGGVKNYVWHDPTTDCFRKLSAAFFTERDSIGTKIKWGTDQANIPPDGPVAGIALYIIYGIVSGSEGNYTLQLNLETGRPRELVKSIITNFSSGFDPFEIGESTANGFGVLYNTIIEFEQKKRDEGEPFAIRPKIKTVPASHVLIENQSTNVEFTLTDCDDAPIKNRTIELSADNGSFDVQNVTTDESGKASAKFTAGNQAGIAKVNGFFKYKMPTELTEMSGTDGGDAYIQIEQQPYWEVACMFGFEEKTFFTQDLQAGRIDREVRRKHDGDVYALIDQNSLGNGIYNTNSTIFSSVIGEYYESINERQQMSTEDENSSVFSSSFTTGYWSGWLHKDEQEISVNIGKNSKHFAFTTLVKEMTGGGQTKSIFVICQDGNCLSNDDFSLLDDPTTVIGDGTHSFDAPKEDQDTTYENVYSPSAGYTITNKVNQMSKKRPDGYFFSYIGQETTEIQQAYSISNTTVKEEIIIEVYTGIKTDVNNDEMMPKNYLFQNSPNPFNPETVIRYSLNKAGYVKLIVYDLLGREVQVLLDSYQNAGNHFARFNAVNLNSGVYLYKLEANGFVSAKKMLMLK